MRAFRKSQLCQPGLDSLERRTFSALDKTRNRHRASAKVGSVCNTDVAKDIELESLRLLKSGFEINIRLLI